MAAFEVLAALVALFVALYFYMTSTADYWAKRGVPYLEPTPFFGNTKEFIFSSEYRGALVQRFYNYAKENGHKCLGVFFGRRPTLILCDVDLIKTVMVKDFQYMMDRGIIVDRKREPLSANLFNLPGGEWKMLRGKLTPTFTSGKMKSMFHLVRECADELDKFLDREIAKDGEQEVAEVLAKFSTDVIGTCAFGVEANSLKDPDAEFRTMGRTIFNVTRWRAILQVIAETLPGLRKYLPVSLIRKDVSNFFTRTFNENMQFREKNNVVRHDFIDLLRQLKEEGGIDESILPAQAFIFFLAGFETSSGATSACLNHLAHHPDVQDKLREEVDRVLAKHGGAPTYDALMEMTYMEQVLEESMRMFPALGIIPRVVTRTYTLPDSKAVLEPGTRVFIPTYAIHYDPEFYPDPHRFDPDRFSDENKKTRPHFAYLPFGEGPRICIGLRFAMMQMKTVLSMLLKSYVVTPSAKSVYPLQFEPKSFVSKAQGGIWVRLSKRQT